MSGSIDDVRRLETGAMLGPYRIDRLIGAGGMGEVYRARDTKLGRDVALKILPTSFASDPERLGRFEREARMLAALSHPHIGAIYGVEEAAPSSGSGQAAVLALVLELVEGETLADRVARGPVPVAEALPIARQIAEALEAAHEKGIIHRDLKPANITVTPEGVVKVLDFGLAKAFVGDASGPDLSQSPTVTVGGTREGMILGTVAYMSPEQARGQPVDKRTDIWAFGCVLYEMLTGKPAFEGEGVSDVLASVIRAEPNWDALPASTPAAARRLLRRCLAKDRKERLPDIAVARLEIIEALAPSEDPLVPAPAPSLRPLRVWQRPIPLATAIVTLIVAAGVAGWALTRPPPLPTARFVQVDAQVSADASLVTDQGPAAVLSPDGSLLAFVARRSGQVRQLFVRRLDQLEATALAGTEDARIPFFSPDGQWLAFFASGKLKKVPVAGGTVVVLCDAPVGRGGSWSDAGWIAFTPHSSGGASLLRVSDTGGMPEPVTALGEGETSHRWPQVLPAAKGVLYSTSKNLGHYNDGDIVLQPLPSGTRKTLVRGGFFGRYLPSGHLTFIHDGRLFAVTFDIDTLEVMGSPVPVLENVARNVSFGAAQFAFADTGTAAFLADAADTAKPLQWLDRDGTTTPFRSSPGDWSNPRLSSTGERLAVNVFDGQQTDLWLYDQDRDTPTRLTFDPAEDWKPLWTPDGSRIVFLSARDSSAYNLFWQRADGGGTAERLTRSVNPRFPASWHPSGSVLAFVETNPSTNFDIMLLPFGGGAPGSPTPFLNSPAAEVSPAFSPDGRWIAYVSSESGRNGVYVRPYPGPGGQWLIAPEGSDPTWSRARRELVFLGPDQRLMVSAYSVDGESFRAGTPRPWSSGRAVVRSRGFPGFDGRAFDLHPDGERAIGGWISGSETVAPQNRVVLAFNFFDEVRRLAPVKR